MKKKPKFKLALEELEHELQRIENDNLVNILGGYQGPGFLDSYGTQAVASYFDSIGLNYTTTDHQTFYIDGIAIPAYETITSGYDVSTDHSSGWGVISQYIYYFQDLGYNFNIVDGDYQYVGNGSGYDSLITEIDPWKRDLQGNPIKTTTNDIYNVDYRGNSSGYDDVEIVLKKVILKDSNNQDFIAYEISGYLDASGIFNVNVPENYRQNCHGYAAGLDMWVFDYPDEAKNEVPQSDANVITFYSSGGIPMHSVRIESNGNIWSKSDTGITKLYWNLDDFFADDSQSGKKYGVLYGNLSRKYFNINRD